jgi:hypothetical protein
MLEFALAIFYPIPHSIEKNMYYEADPYTGFRLKPGSVGHFQMGIPADANSHGHRDVEVPLKKPSGIFRILVLGDSLTVGTNVQQEEAYPKIIERRLKTIFGDKIQVVNAAVGGWQPFQYAEYFKRYGYQFEPDLVLVGFAVGSDPFDSGTRPEHFLTAVLGHRVSREAAAQPFIKLKIFLYDHSNLARLLWNHTPTAGITVLRAKCDDFLDEFLEVERDRMSNHLRDSATQRSKAENSINQIKRIKDEVGDAFPVIVALLPDENQINPVLRSRVIPPEKLADYDLEMPQSMLTEMFHHVGLPTIDLLPAMRADHRCLYMNDTHWNVTGNELAASIISDQIAPVIEKTMQRPR